MTYQVLARKWRPQTFEEVIGQDHVSRTLRNAIIAKRVGHAYLFSGPRGVGKTTVARILAKALNCQEGPTPTPCNKCTLCQEITEDRSLDVLEIDGASNTHVADIQELRGSVKYTPAHGRYKIYIIDEIHMLSKHAFNALLKTLEEPPAHVIFIFATTEPQKIPLTILSRCQRFDFRRLSTPHIIQRLAYIIANEKDQKIDAEPGALAIIARRAEGSMRDAQSLLDQVIAYAGDRIDEQSVSEALGLAKRDVFFQFLEAIRQRDSRQALKLVATVEEQGWDTEDFAQGVLEHLRFLLLTKIDPQSPEMEGLSQADRQRYAEQARNMEQEDLLRMMSSVSEMTRSLRYSSQPRFLLEILAVKLTKMEEAVQLVDVLEGLNRVLGGETAEKPPTEKPGPVARETSANTLSATTTAPETAQGTGDLWGQVVDRVSKKKTSLGALLQHGQLGEMEERVLTISFPKSCNFHRERAQMQKNREVIEGEASAILGREVRVRFTLADIPEPAKSSARSKGRQPSLEDVIKADPVVGEILETLDGEVFELQ